MAKKNGQEGWILETGRPYAVYEDPQLNPRFKEICEIYETQGSYGLEEKFPNQAKKMGTLNPHKLYTEEMAKGTRKYPADEEGTMEIPADDEAAAIHLFKAFSAVNAKTHFNEKYGLPMPSALKRQLEQVKKEQDDIQRLILRGGLGSR